MLECADAFIVYIHVVEREITFYVKFCHFVCPLFPFVVSHPLRH